MYLKNSIMIKIRRAARRFSSDGNARKVDLPELTAREGYNRWAGSYGDVPTPVQELESPALEKNLPDLSGKNVLDLGCGRGRVSQLAMQKGARLAVGLDLSDNMIRMGGNSTPKILGNAGALPFRPQTFNLVVCALLLGHIRKLETTLQEVHRVLRPGGELLITDFHPFATLRGWDRSFVERNSGKAYAIEQYCHLFSDYFAIFKALGMVPIEFEEFLYRQDFPLIFLLKARKQPGGEAQS